ncbi:MAG: glycosyltransferase [Candidatus Frackibacter sp. T328-2]|nr:MAG: glycosyltransferase [Candidatus Frackibacter sp. T328-2]
MKNKSLNILQISAAKFYGGGEVHLYHLTERLIERGHNLTVVVKDRIVKNFKNLDTDLRSLPLKNVLDLFSLYNLVKIIKEKEIDIIHCHTGIDYWLGAMAKGIAKRGKVIATRHSLNSLGDSFAHKKLYKSIDKFIVVSNRVKEKIIDPDVILESKVEVVYNGVDINRFNPELIDSKSVKEEFEIKDDELIVGTVGRLGGNKNQELLIKAAAEVDNKKLKVKYLIVGDDVTNDKHYERKLKELITNLDLKDRVVLTGFRSDIPQLMKAFDVMVFPTKKEAFGIVAIEAMAMSKPVIASAVGGLKEIVTDETTGLLFSVDDKEELVKAMVTLLSKPELRERIGYKGCQRVMNNFTLSNMVGKIENIYLKLI